MTLTLDSPKLRELTRTQLQFLAKREVVRAVGKTEDIIRRLIRKHPRGVPAPEYVSPALRFRVHTKVDLSDADNPSASSAPPKRNVLKRSRKGTPSPSVVLETSEDCMRPKGEGEPLAEATAPSPSSSIEALEQLLYPEDEPVAGPSNTNPGSILAPHLEVAESEALPDHLPAEPVAFPGELSPVPPSGYPSRKAPNEDEDTRSAAPNPGWQADDDEEPDNVYDEYGYPTGAPNHYMVVDALRQFTTLVNTIPSMETRIAESRCLLQRTETLLEKATPDARELTVTREYLETFLLAKMKKKQELWDGTARMNKQDRKLRMAWLRAERKAENEKRWKEANELNAKHGLAPEPFSAFASESDEEVIESLQTTPASSSNGSSKRSREESLDVGSDGDAQDESQRKRARS